ncbi:hypothetical protein ACLOJK_040714 [Asimina triloba]
MVHVKCTWRAKDVTELFALSRERGQGEPRASEPSRAGRPRFSLACFLLHERVLELGLSHPCRNPLAFGKRGALYPPSSFQIPGGPHRPMIFDPITSVDFDIVVASLPTAQSLYIFIAISESSPSGRRADMERERERSNVTVFPEAVVGDPELLQKKKAAIRSAGPRKLQSQMCIENRIRSTRIIAPRVSPETVAGGNSGSPSVTHLPGPSAWARLLGYTLGLPVGLSVYWAVIWVCLVPAHKLSLDLTGTGLSPFSSPNAGNKGGFSAII